MSLRPVCRPRVSYEWTWEIEDEYGDITSQGFGDTFAECRREAPADAGIALMRRYGSDDDGEIPPRGYAYCQPGPGVGLVLPEFFDNGVKVPQRFHAEVAA
jgi:hypothetical protein